MDHFFDDDTNFKFTVLKFNDKVQKTGEEFKIFKENLTKIIEDLRLKDNRTTRREQGLLTVHKTLKNVLKQSSIKQA